MKKRIISIFMVVSLLVPCFVFPSSALVPAIPGGVAVAPAVVQSAVFAAGARLAIGEIAGFFGNDEQAVQSVLNYLVSVTGYGEMTYSGLQAACNRLDQIAANPDKYARQMFEDCRELGYGFLVDDYGLFYDILVQWVSLRNNLTDGWHIVESTEVNGYVIANQDESFILADSVGRYPYAAEVTDKWLGSRTALSASTVTLATDYSLKNLQSVHQDLHPEWTFRRTNVTLQDGKYTVLQAASDGIHYDQILCDSLGFPYGIPLGNTQMGNDRDYNNDKEGQPEVSDEPIVDIDANLVYQMFPDGSFTWINNLTYDASNKTYYVDASTSYETENNYYYSYEWHYTYHIDYTSITYIGQTAEYDEVYEYYYQLPDGRSSADLTAEELQALNTQIDVLPYIRSADDTSIRALYHFDGDIRDASYWNYIGAMSWQQGASITYMDAGSFGGALYLDETDHQYTITLPSGLGSSDFMLQFRLYQSHTLTPQDDTYLSIGDVVFLRFDGENILDSAGNVIAPLSIGSWQEICLQRTGGNVVVFHNGVPVTTFAYASSLGDTVGFVWGSGQQTYKYFDELRVLNKSSYPASGYIPTAVPYDTNLSLVLPDSHVPLADEYWTFNNSGNLLPLQDFSSGVSDSTFWHSDGSLMNNNHVYHTNYGIYKTSDSVLTFQSFNGFSSIHNPYAPLFGVGSNTGVYINLGMGIFSLNSSNGGSFYSWTGDLSFDTPYTFSLMSPDGALDSLTFSIPKQHMSYGLGSGATILYTYQFTSGMQAALIYRPLYDTTYARGELMLAIFPPTGNLDFVYMEIVPGTQPNTGHEFISSIAPVNSDFNTPSLAVRTDVDITSYQIGGVRPSLPEKGMVWAMVENSRITSLQVYNGQAWEEVDGRIWTGSRWVPYYAYDVVLLKDLYDVVGTDPTMNPIYSETGFWTWLQTAWKDMIARLDTLISLGGSGGGGVVLPPDVSTQFPGAEDDPTTDENEGWTVIDLAVTLKDGVWTIVKGVVRVGINGFGSLVTGVSNIGGFFDAYDPDIPGGVLDIMNVGSESVWD